MKEFVDEKIAVLLILFLISSCQPPSHLIKTSEKEGGKEVEYTLIYLIHGDGSYLYHDKRGIGKEADEQVVQEARAVGQAAEKGEVFIFHQRPERKVLWLFPQKDRRFYHYQKGHLVHQEKYSPSSEDSSFSAEAAIFRQLRSEESGRKILLYYGHEIPQQNKGYHSSRPEAAFNTETFATGISTFLQDSSSFDLTILSTCDNGTPEMAAKLSPFSNTLLASPKNLHLSHIDSDSLLQLEKEPNMPAIHLGRKVARDTYLRLKEFMQTSVTLSVYNLKHQKEDIMWLQQAYKDYNRTQNNKFLMEENRDCSQFTFWNESKAPNVSYLFYKPPQFGSQTPSRNFSGWGC